MGGQNLSPQEKKNRVSLSKKTVPANKIFHVDTVSTNQVQHLVYSNNICYYTGLLVCPLPDL